MSVTRNFGWRDIDWKGYFWVSLPLPSHIASHALPHSAPAHSYFWPCPSASDNLLAVYPASFQFVRYYTCFLTVNMELARDFVFVLDIKWVSSSIAPPVCLSVTALVCLSVGHQLFRQLVHWFVHWSLRWSVHWSAQWSVSLSVFSARE